MPELVRLYIRSMAVGFGVSAAFTLGLVWLDVAGIGHLIMASDIGLIALVMMVVFNGILFSSVQFAIRVMALADDGEGPKGGRGAPELVPIRVTVPVKGRRRH